MQLSTTPCSPSHLPTSSQVQHTTSSTAYWHYKIWNPSRAFVACLWCGIASLTKKAFEALLRPCGGADVFELTEHPDDSLIKIIPLSNTGWDPDHHSACVYGHLLDALYDCSTRKLLFVSRIQGMDTMQVELQHLQQENTPCAHHKDHCLHSAPHGPLMSTTRQIRYGHQYKGKQLYVHSKGKHHCSRNRYYPN